MQSTLENFMRTLQRAGFDIQTILSHGYEYALVEAERLNPADQQCYAAEAVADAAELLGIDRETQLKDTAEGLKKIRER